ncbi:MAG: response regulator [Geobacter sp.]|nr:response regulator [Geobacter sp.]
MAEKKHLGDLLVEAGIITVKTLERALDRQKGTRKRLGMVLEEMGVITEEELAEALAKQFNFKTVKNLTSYSFPADLLQMVPQDLALQKLVFPLKRQDVMLALAITDPFDEETIEFISKRTGLKVYPVLTTRQEILSAISKHYLKGEEAKPPQRKRILVVEDTATVATVIKVALEKEGYEVLMASDGLEGLKLALTEKPDLIISDAVMPRMDAYEMQRTLKANAASVRIPIIILTSKASSEDEQKALEAGFLDFIPKPVNIVRVLSRVKRGLELMDTMQKR